MEKLRFVGGPISSWTRLTMNAIVFFPNRYFVFYICKACRYSYLLVKGYSKQNQAFYTVLFYLFLLQKQLTQLL